jgi:hypothetical protein
MKRSFLMCALFLGACVSQPAHGQTISPVGTWEVDVLDSGKGVLMMTFSNNFTVSGYGITQKQFGFITLAGNWSTNSKGDVVAAYIQTVNGVGSAYTLTARMLSSGRFRGKATGRGGGYQCEGEQPESFSDLSGSWNAAVKRKGKSFTLSGAIIASSHDAVNASLNRIFGTDTQHSSLSGVFKSSRSEMRMQGSDDTGAHLSETAVRQ